MNPLKIASIAGLIALMWSASVAASTLNGAVVMGSYDFPDTATTNVGGYSYFVNPFVVSGPAAQTALFVGNPVFYSAWDVFFTGNSLTMAPAPLTYASYTADPFNGPIFSVVSGSAFASVTDVVTNLHCTPCDPVTAFVSGGSLYVDWAGAGGNVGDTIRVGFTVTPIPATLPLFVGGLGALWLISWRRNRAAAISSLPSIPLPS
jgi:hypothetical protein